MVWQGCRESSSTTPTCSNGRPSRGWSVASRACWPPRSRLRRRVSAILRC